MKGPTGRAGEEEVILPEMLVCPWLKTDIVPRLDKHEMEVRGSAMGGREGGRDLMHEKLIRLRLSFTHSMIAMIFLYNLMYEKYSWPMNEE